MIRRSFLARRIKSSRLLLATVMLTVLATAALGAALASFAAQSLPQAVRGQLARSPALSIVVRGAMAPPQVGPAGRIVRAGIGRALAGVPYRLDQALWSDPLGLAATRGSRIIPLVEVATLGQIQARAVLTAGAWPAPPRRGQPLGIALPAVAARQLRARPGTILRSRDRNSGERISLRVTGLYRPADPASPYWGIDLIGPSGINSQPPFITYGPAVTSPAAFGRRGLAVSQVSWIALPSAAGIRGGDLTGLAGQLSQATAALQGTNSLGGAQVTTGLPQLLSGLASNLVVARSLLVIGALQLALLATAALALAARLLAGHRVEETALLTARGATRWQLAAPTLAETLLFGGLAAAAGVLAGTFLAAALVRITEPGTRISLAHIPASAWWAALAVLALAAAVVLWPAVRPTAAGAARVRRGRQAALAGAARTGADLALLALAVLAVWELHTYSAVAASSAGGIGIDPVIAVAPALALAAVTVIPLRLIPVGARLIERVAARGRRLATALAGWQVSRRPIRQSGPILLVILATAATTLALAQYQTSRRSAADQAAFAAGADLRADIPQPLSLAAAGMIPRSPGVRTATPVARVSAAPAGSAGSAGELLAVDARGAADTVLLRSDLAPYPARELWSRLVRPQPAPGLAIPGRPAQLKIMASLTPGSASSSPGPVSVTASIQDADGTVYLVGAGSLAADGRVHTLTAGLSPARQAAYPLRLLGLSLSYNLRHYRPGSPFRPAGAAGQARFVINGLATWPGGRPFAAGRALAPWSAGVSSLGLYGAGTPPDAAVAASSGVRPALVGWQRAGSSQQLRFLVGYSPSAAALVAASAPTSGFLGEVTITARAPAGPVPAIATASFLRAANSGVGRILPVSVDGVTIPVRIVAAVRAFPTVASGGALVVDQAPVQAILASQSAPPLPVTEWWLASSNGEVPAVLRSASVTDRAALTAALLGNSLSVPPRQAALAVGLAAALLAAIGFSASIAASVRDRRAESAVLSALGVARAAQTGQFCLEQLMLSAPAAAAGLLIGAALARLVVPALTLTAAGTRPVPPVLVQIPAGWAVLLAGAVAAFPVLAAAASAARRPDPVADLRAAEAS
jgi:FtsX-like permease family protein